MAGYGSIIPIAQENQVVQIDYDSKRQDSWKIKIDVCGLVDKEGPFFLLRQGGLFA
ncbi:hypothetical protein [Neomoorella thermoacetica]|uniref:Uncharacterized protein n=1 Tax=Neomoorella thermoacetica TaxID=1525 RepID=A0A1J5NFK3_NEOTH|nr:hypothetical protein [Moorella thermoacetica]OIQ08988.1 hypothetical protein MOOR_13850 [Moorella thermoacetica]OIQ54703.1 hypothetical protein MORE_10810 [Moorella thermoacetica]